MNLLALLVPTIMVGLIVLLSVLLGRKSPEASLYAILLLPLAALSGLVLFFTAPSVRAGLNLNDEVLAQLLAASTGAVLGVIGAGIIAIVQNRWADAQSMLDRDWQMRTALAERLTHYPFNAKACSHAEKLEIIEILNHASHDASLAKGSGVIPQSSVFDSFIEEMRAHYPPPE